MKINKLEIENVKRVKAVAIEPTPSGLTVIGGKNRQGKTSVLDAIAWALGGDRYRPSQAQRDGSVLPPNIHIVMDNGLVVERKGKNSDLKVIDPAGNKGGQQLLNEFVEQLAIDLPRFMQASNGDKAKTLLQIIGVGDKLHELEHKEQEVYNRRHAIGQIADQKKKYAKEQAYYPDAPKEPIAASDLIKQQQEILARNGENQRHRDNYTKICDTARALKARIEEAEAKLAAMREEQAALKEQYYAAQKTVEELQDESTAELKANIAQIEEINVKVRANLDKEKAEDDAKEYENQYNTLTGELADVRKEKTDLLTGANLPLPGLSVEDGELTYEGKKWDNMSGADQLKVSTAIVRQLNPKCGFVLLDKLEQMDVDTLQEFGAWLEAEGLQAIATRVSTGGECSIIIEDGYAVNTMQYQATEDQLKQEAATAPAKQWEGGIF